MPVPMGSGSSVLIEGPCALVSLEDVDVLMDTLQLLAAPHPGPVSASDLSRPPFHPRAREVLERFRDFRSRSVAGRVFATVAGQVGSGCEHVAGECVIDDADGISTATAARLLDLAGPRWVVALIGRHEVCARRRRRGGREWLVSESSVRAYLARERVA